MRLNLLSKLEAHDDGAWSVAWVPGSNLLLTGSVDESVKLWEDAADQPLNNVHTYTGHTLGVVSVVVDPTGTFAASSALDSFLRVWNLRDHSVRAVIENNPTETWGIAFSPDSSKLRLAVAAGTAQRVLMYNIAEDSESPEHQFTVMELPKQAAEERHRRERFVLSVAYNNDGTRLAAGAMDGSVTIFDTATETVVRQLEGHYKPVRSLSYTPDGKMLLTACDDMHTNLYDAETGQLVESFSGHESWVLSVAAHPNGSNFATGSSDAHVKLWDIRTRACVQTLADHTDQVWGISFGMDGSRLASVGDDKQVAVYSCA